MIAVAFEMLALSGAVAEREGIVEDKIEIVIEIEGQGRVARARESCRLQPRIVEDLIGAVERYGEQRLGSPFEAAGLAIGQPHRRRTVSDQRIEEGLVEMLDRARLAPRRNLDDVIGHEVARAVGMGKAAARVVAR